MLAMSETSGAMVNWINSYAISDIANIAALLQNLGIGIGWMYHFRTSRPEGGRPPPRDHLVDVRAERLVTRSCSKGFEKRYGHRSCVPLFHTVDSYLDR